MHRAGDIKRVSYSGITVKMVMRKNSLGPSRLSINVDLIWWADEERDFIQRTKWDWHAATVNLLTSFEGSRAKKIQDICGIRVVDKSKKLACSDLLGISRSDPLPYSQLGELLEQPQHEEIMKGLHRIMGIYEYPVFQVGVDYREQLEAAKAAAENTEQPTFGEANFTAEDGDGDDE
jgi:hypothetical protein